MSCGKQQVDASHAGRQVLARQEGFAVGLAEGPRPACARCHPIAHHDRPAAARCGPSRVAVTAGHHQEAPPCLRAHIHCEGPPLELCPCVLLQPDAVHLPCPACQEDLHHWGGSRVGWVGTGGGGGGSGRGWANERQGRREATGSCTGWWAVGGWVGRQGEQRWQAEAMECTEFGSSTGNGEHCQCNAEWVEGAHWQRLAWQRRRWPCRPRAAR